MELNQIASAIADMVAAAREGAAEAAGRSYGAEREYARALNDALPPTWFKVEHNDKGAEANLVHAEKALYFKALHEKHPAKKYPNPSVPWARVRKYAQEELEADIRKQAAESGEALPEGAAESAESTGARHRKTLTLAMVDELTPLYKRGRKAETEGTILQREAKALVHIASALGELGIDIAAL